MKLRWIPSSWTEECARTRARLSLSESECLHIGMSRTHFVNARGCLLVALSLRNKWCINLKRWKKWVADFYYYLIWAFVGIKCTHTRAACGRQTGSNRRNYVSLSIDCCQYCACCECNTLKVIAGIYRHYCAHWHVSICTLFVVDSMSRVYFFFSDGYNFNDMFLSHFFL